MDKLIHIFKEISLGCFLMGHIKSLTTEKCECYGASVFFKLILPIQIMSTPCETDLWWVPQNSIEGSGNGLVPSGNKPLYEPMLTSTYVTIRHH